MYTHQTIRPQQPSSSVRQRFSRLAGIRTNTHYPRQGRLHNYQVPVATKAPLYHHPTFADSFSSDCIMSSQFPRVILINTAKTAVGSVFSNTSTTMCHVALYIISCGALLLKFIHWSTVVFRGVVNSPCMIMSPTLHKRKTFAPTVLLSRHGTAVGNNHSTFSLPKNAFLERFLIKFRWSDHWRELFFRSFLSKSALF